MAEKVASGGWLLWRNTAAGPEFMGVYETKEDAQKDAGALEGTAMGGDWRTDAVPLIGWTFLRGAGRVLNDNLTPAHSREKH